MVSCSILALISHRPLSLLSLCSRIYHPLSTSPSDAHFSLVLLVLSLISSAHCLNVLTCVCVCVIVVFVLLSAFIHLVPSAPCEYSLCVFALSITNVYLLGSNPTVYYVHPVCFSLSIMSVSVISLVLNMSLSLTLPFLWTLWCRHFSFILYLLSFKWM